MKRSVKVHIWGCFLKQGFGSLHIFIDNLNAAKMIKIYYTVLLLSAQKWFTIKNKNYILQEDIDVIGPYSHQIRIPAKIFGQL